MRKTYLNHKLLLPAFFLLVIKASAQLQVTPVNTAAGLAQALAGPGVQISNASMNCPTDAAGTFVGTASNIGIAGGILLTTGQVSDAVGPNNSPGAGIDNMATYVDPDLTAIEPLATYNTCIVEFDAVPSCSTLAFTFSFGSEEYMEWVNSSYNDVFGIFVSGPNPTGPAYNSFNMALIPGTPTPVSIDNVNLNQNATYYFDNETPPGTTVQYDGFTVPIPVTLNVVPCTTYHFKLAIADAGDGIVDSGVFFEQQSLACNPVPIVIGTSTTPAACTANNGSASATPTGGTAPYTYTWSTNPPQTTQTATGLAPGTYTVNIVDATACFFANATVTITGGGGFSTTSAQTDVSCFGANDGSATVTPAGGNAPFTYSWSTNPVQSTPTISNLPAGNYTCTVTDMNGCIQTQTVTIVQPPAITGTITATVNASCPGASDGSATVSGSGGAAPFNYAWNSNPPQAGATASNLPAGNFVVTISDANGCTTTQSVTITEPPAINTSFSTTDASCGLSDGTAGVTATGGASPYTYLWLTNPVVQTTAMATGLASATYSLIITDANGCLSDYTITVAGGKPPVANFVFSPEEVSSNDPVVAFTDVSAGNGFTWSWDFGDVGSGSDNFSTVQHPTHAFSDTGVFCIQLLISDLAGTCKDSITKCLKVESPFTFYVPNTFTPNGDGINEYFKGYGTYIGEFEMNIFDRWGNLIFTTNNLNEGWDGTVQPGGVDMSGSSGQYAPQDVYVWKVRLTDHRDNPRMYVGHVNLVR